HVALLFGLSHVTAGIGTLLSFGYFSHTAQKLHFDYFRDERLGLKITVKAKFDFLFGLCQLFVSIIFLTAGTFFAASLLGYRLGTRLILAALVAAFCHSILPWVFVLSPDSHRRGRRLLTYDEAQAIAQMNLPAGD